MAEETKAEPPAAAAAADAPVDRVFLRKWNAVALWSFQGTGKARVRALRGLVMSLLRVCCLQTLCAPYVGTSLLRNVR